MSCVDWEERIALYAGGDLAAAEAQAVERHVAECGGCQLLLSGLRESLGLLREAHGEPVEAAHFAAVRARVINGESYAAIAHELSVSETVARQRVSRGLAALRMKLGKEQL